MSNFLIRVWIGAVCMGIAPLSWAQESAAIASASLVTDSTTMVGTIMANVYDIDQSTNAHHSIVVVWPDADPFSPIEIEFNRLEPILAIGTRVAFTFDPIPDGSNSFVSREERQVFKLSIKSVRINPPGPKIVVTAER